MTEAAWATAIIEPNRDFEAARNLPRAGFRTVFLTYRKLLTGHNRPGWRTANSFILMPLFPGYIFVELWPDQPWPKQGSAGFQGFVCSDRKPLTLEHEMVWGWQMLVRSGEFDDHKPGTCERPKFRPATDPDERRRLLRERFRTQLDQHERLGA